MQHKKSGFSFLKINKKYFKSLLTYHEIRGNIISTKAKEINDMRKEIWSVELEATLWTDDTFNGTYDECVEWCRKNDYKIDGEEARLARLLVEGDCVLEVLEIVDDLNSDNE